MYMDHIFLPLMWKQCTERFMQPTTTVRDTLTMPTTSESSSTLLPDTCHHNSQRHAQRHHQRKHR